MVSLMNAILFIVPLVALLFGVMVQYYTREFTELLLAQPPTPAIDLPRSVPGIATALAMSFPPGGRHPFILSGIFSVGEIWNFSILLLSGGIVVPHLSALGYLLALMHDNRIRGFGLPL